MRAQRHDFIKEYYKMATADLDRHLKAGWQTIAVLAGGAAILAAGHEGKIGLPIAVTIALISAFWGTLTVIDANYWSIRAIAFLSNVEAIYFSAQDRAYFNPYVGGLSVTQVALDVVCREVGRVRSPGRTPDG